jgi:hypothetical protein
VINRIQDSKAMMFQPMRAVAALLICVALTGTATTAYADVKDYEFQLVDPAVKIGPAAIVTVRLLNKITGKPVPDAVIFASRLDMTPDSMPEMTKLTPMPGSEPGTYRFKANLSMAGGWQLSLGAKVQGESGTVQSKLVIWAEK